MPSHFQTRARFSPVSHQEPGLLSRAFKSTRTLSLSNLLDLGIEDIDKLVLKVRVCVCHGVENI
jgi:hypothetical protein